MYARVDGKYDELRPAQLRHPNEHLFIKVPTHLAYLSKCVFILLSRSPPCTDPSIESAR